MSKHSVSLDGKPLLFGKHCRGSGCDDFNEQQPRCWCKCDACTKPMAVTEAAKAELRAQVREETLAQVRADIATAVQGHEERAARHPEGSDALKAQTLRCFGEMFLNMPWSKSSRSA